MSRSSSTHRREASAPPTPLTATFLGTEQYKLACTMTPRFPIDEAPDSAAKQTMEDALTKMHGGAPPFQWIEDDGRSLIGCYAPLW